MTEPRPESASMDFDKTFRPAKRRKFYRKRNDEDEDDGSNLINTRRDQSTTPLSLDELVIIQGETGADTQLHTEGSLVPIAEILRLRKNAQRKKGGIEFTNTSTANKIAFDGAQLNNAILESDDAVADADKVISRFAPQTGQVADVDKHMYVLPAALQNSILMQRLT